MRFPLRRSLFLLALAPFITGLSCGSGIVRKVEVNQPKTAVGKPLQHSQRFANPLSAADTALSRRALEGFAWLAASIPENSPTIAGSSGAVVASQPSTSATAAASSSTWDCIAIAERSGHDNPAMGPTYWTEYGVVIDVIQDYGTPEEQAAIFGGTADAATRLAPVARFALKNGFGGWGVLTKQKCGL